MLSFISLKSKSVYIAVLLMFCSTNIMSASLKDAHEHIAKADAIFSQKMEFNIEDGKSLYTIQTNNQTFVFEIEENTALTQDAYTQNNGVVLYKGKIRGQKDSWVRLSKHEGQIEGAFYDGHALFFIENYLDLESSISVNDIAGFNAATKASENSASLVINVNDIHSTGTCALHDDHIIEGFNYNNYVDDLAQMLNAQANKQIQISLVADTQFVASSSNATADMLNYLNIADGVFSEQIGVHLSLSETIELSDNGTLNTNNPTDLIRAFRHAGYPNPGVSHLFTNRDLTGSTVGIAYMGSLCRDSSVGITQKLGSKTALIFTHELGHNFGAPHDNQSGSNCSATPSGFVMNPNVNGGSLTFSQCSITEMAPVIDYGMNGFGACITEISDIAPTITSTPNLLATVGQAYQYDQDNQLEVSGSGPITFALEIGPEGMVLDELGNLTWTPNQNQVGVNTVQIRVSNLVGDDIQVFDVVVESLSAQEYINFNETTLSSFGNKQDLQGGATISENGYQLELSGNTWKSIPFEYEVTPNTLVSFDFMSRARGEIHGIAFENDNDVSSEISFQIHGSQNWARKGASYSAQGQVQHFTIPVGQFISGQFNKLVFIMDNDVNNSAAESIFSNVVVYEEGQEILPIVPPEPYLDFNILSVTSHLPNDQDMVGTVDVIENGKGIKLTGNKWQKVVLNGQPIDSNTIISFEFKTDVLGEIHGFGIFDGDFIDSELAFQLAGKQNWARGTFNYANNGEWQAFEIPIGQFLTSSNAELVFIMDDDANSAGTSYFRNIKFSQAN